ncbi:MAG: AmmeMemoRadiSam system radical SAM enzyme [Anaerolineae bacterium]
MKQESLALRLDRLTEPGLLVEPLAAKPGWVRCLACAHQCKIGPGRRGICQVRFNADGVLRVPFGYVAGLQCDPVEKKPFNHVLPGSQALTFGMLGCDLHCDYCQNWLTSQALRDDLAGASPQTITAAEIAAAGQRLGAALVVSSYNEPLITSEWAVAVFKAARQRGLHTAFVSNGNATRAVLTFLRPWVDAYKIDLKTMHDRRYRQLGAVLADVLDGIRLVFELGFWLEIVTLVVPGFNDDPGELAAAAEFIVGLSPDIPWHVTAFHQDYRMRDPAHTVAQDLVRAAEIGRKAGLRYVYAGNLPGRLGDWEHTVCPQCQARLVTRRGFQILEQRIGADGCCPQCGLAVPGIWR